MAKGTYHHGDLRRVLLDAAVVAIGESGPAALSLRDLARRAGVSHAAPTHHFGDKAGLLTALAVEGYETFARELTAIGSFLEMGVAYVHFAVTHPAHFEVMFRPELYRADDPELVAARERAAAVLYAGVAELRGYSGVHPAGGDDVREAGLAAWSMAHGFATLWLSGALPDLGTDPDAAARTILGRLARDP